MTQPAYSLDAARQAFPITEHLTYLNHASISPLPRPTLEIVHQAADRLASDPASFFMPGPDLLADVFTRFSTELAAFVNAERPHEVVPLTSTSGGMNVLARVVDWSPGDNVIMCDVEFPSNVYPFMALAGQGVELRLVRRIRAGCRSPRWSEPPAGARAVVVVSSVQFFSGHRADLAALGAFCRARGILFVVDAIQSAGHIPIDVQAGQIDVLLAGGQKSLMSAPGVGLMYVREAAAERLRVPLCGRERGRRLGALAAVRPGAAPRRAALLYGQRPACWTWSPCSPACAF